MNLTIIPIDGAVYVNGYSYSQLDLSFVPNDVHALQWENDKGWVEFKNLDNGTKPQNESITELPSWANQAKVKWDEAKADEEAKAAEEAAILAAQEDAQNQTQNN